MATRFSHWSRAFIIVFATSATWVIVAVPIAAAVSAIRFSLLFLFVLRQMAWSAAVLGGIQGVWVMLADGLYRSGGSELSGPKSVDVRWFAAVSGGVLGLLGFLPVYSHTTIVVGMSTLISLVVSAVGGGIAAGVVSGVVLFRGRLNPMAVAQSVIVGGLLVLALTAIEYAVYWNGFVERLPLPRAAVANLPAGDAKGTDWSGCYKYFAIDSGGGGAEGGPLVVKQEDGLLEVSVDHNSPLRGGIEQDGNFRVGSETKRYQTTVRSLWEGRFGSGLVFTARTTALHDGRVNTTAIQGVGKRTPCSLQSHRPENPRSSGDGRDVSRCNRGRKTERKAHSDGLTPCGLRGAGGRVPR